MIRREVSDVEGQADSLQTSGLEWHPEAVKMNQHRVYTLCFPTQTQRPRAQAEPAGCGYSCRLGAIYKDNHHSKHERVCGSDGRSS